MYENSVFVSLYTKIIRTKYKIYSKQKHAT